MANVIRRDDETKIAKSTFDAAQAAISAFVEVDLAGALGETRVFQVGLESH